MDNHLALPPKDRVCSFTGHRDLTYAQMEAALPHLTEAVTRLHAKGISTFIAGGAMGFDTLAAIQIINLRRHLFPDLRLVLAIPCPGQADRWPPPNQALYTQIRREADQEILLSDRYFPGCMQQRNAFMVNHSSHLLAYVTRTSGGSYQTLTLARRQGLHIQNLAPDPTGISFLEQQGLLGGI